MLTWSLVYVTFSRLIRCMIKALCRLDTWLIIHRRDISPATFPVLPPHPIHMSETNNHMMPPPPTPPPTVSSFGMLYYTWQTFNSDISTLGNGIVYLCSPLKTTFPIHHHHHQHVPTPLSICTLSTVFCRRTPLLAGGRINHAPSHLVDYQSPNPNINSPWASKKYFPYIVFLSHNIVLEYFFMVKTCSLVCSTHQCLPDRSSAGTVLCRSIPSCRQLRL